MLSRAGGVVPVFVAQHDVGAPEGRVLLVVPAEQPLRVAVPPGHQTAVGDLDDGDQDARLRVDLTGEARRGTGLALDLEPHALGGVHVVDPPRRGERRRDQQAAAVLGVVGGRLGGQRQRATGMEVLHLEAQAGVVEEQTDPDRRTGVQHGVRDELAGGERGAVDQVRRPPRLELAADEQSRLRDRSVVRRERADTAHECGRHRLQEFLVSALPTW